MKSVTQMLAGSVLAAAAAGLMVSAWAAEPKANSYRTGPGACSGGGGPGTMGCGGGPGMMGGFGGGPGMMGGYGGGPGMMGGYGGGPGMMGPASLPDLTQDQRSKITQIQDDLRKKHWDVMGKMREEQFKLQELYYADKRDNVAINDQYKKLQDLQRQMWESNVDTQKGIEAVLTK